MAYEAEGEDDTAFMPRTVVGIGCDARLMEERDAVPPEEFTRRLGEVARNSARTRRKILPLWSNPR